MHEPEEKGKPCFAALPMRALGDDRLTGLHLRALAAIAAHDRFGRNGTGCWASPARLAEIVGCNDTNLITAITELVEMGYVARERQPDDKRKRVYRVRYTDADHHVFNDRLPTGNQSDGDRLPGRPRSLALESSNPLNHSNVFPLRESKRSRKNDRRNPVKRRRLNDGADCVESTGMKLRRLEAMSSAGTELSPEEARGWFDWLEDVRDVEGGHDGTGLGGWAMRLMDYVAPFFVDEDGCPTIGPMLGTGA